MKTQTAFLISGLLFLSSCFVKVSEEKDLKYKVSEKNFSFSQSFNAPQTVNLKISTSGGDISTYGYEGNQIEVDFVVRKYGKVVEITLEKLKKIADVKIQQDSSNLEISISNIKQRNISVGFNIKTPVQTKSYLHTSGGDITIESLNASQILHTSGGDLSIKDVTGEVEAHTSGGDINLENIRGKLNAETSGGDINASVIKPEIRANTSGGDISIFDAEGIVEVGTSGGDIKLDQIKGSVKANTSGGDITANLDTPTEALTLETSGGDIHCAIPQGLGINLDLSGDEINTPLTNFSGRADKHKIQGQMNGGGILITLNSFGGTIDLNYK